MTHRQYLIDALQTRREAAGEAGGLDELLAQLDLCVRIPCAIDVAEPDPDGPEPPLRQSPADLSIAELRAELRLQVNAGLWGRSFTHLVLRGRDLVIAASASTDAQDDPEMEGFAWLHDVLTLAAVVEELDAVHRKPAESVLDTCWTLLETGPEAFPSAPGVAERRFALEGDRLPEPLRRTLEVFSKVAVLRLSEWAVAEREAKRAQGRGREFWQRVRHGVEARQVGEGVAAGAAVFDQGFGEWAPAAMSDEPSLRRRLGNGWTILFLPQPGNLWEIQPDWKHSPEGAWDRNIEIRWRGGDGDVWSSWHGVGACEFPIVARTVVIAEGSSMEIQVRWSAT